MRRMTLLSAILVGSAASAALAATTPQSAAAASPPPAAVSEGAAPPAPEDLARLVAAYLASKGWQEGENPTVDPANRVVVAVGTGVIDAPSSDAGWAAARVGAYRQAMLDSQRRLAKYLGQAISRAAALQVTERSAGGAAGEPAVRDNLGRISEEFLRKKLDDVLREQGLDPHKADPEAVRKAIEKAIATRTFKDTVEAVANAQTTGLCAFKVFEGLKGDGTGEIRVVAVYSDFMRQMAESVRSGAAPPKEQPRRPLAEQIPPDSQLVATFGVQPRVDEKGDVWLLSFGQAAAAGNSAAPGAEKSAFDKAELQADGDLRSFAGEVVMVVERGGIGGIAATAPDGERAFADRTTYEQLVRTRAESMPLKGVRTLAQRKLTHPITGKPVFVVVREWSLQAAELAQPGSAGAGATGSSKPGTPASGAGANPDDDATGTKKP